MLRSVNAGEVVGSSVSAPGVAAGNPRAFLWRNGVIAVWLVGATSLLLPGTTFTQVERQQSKLLRATTQSRMWPEGRTLEGHRMTKVGLTARLTPGRRVVGASSSRMQDPADRPDSTGGSLPGLAGVVPVATLLGLPAAPARDAYAVTGDLLPPLLKAVVSVWNQEFPGVPLSNNSLIFVIRPIEFYADLNAPQKIWLMSREMLGIRNFPLIINPLTPDDDWYFRAQQEWKRGNFDAVYILLTSIFHEIAHTQHNADEPIAYKEQLALFEHLARQGKLSSSLRANISETSLVPLINEQKGEKAELRDEREFSWCCSFLWGFGCRGTKRRLASWRAAAQWSGSQNGRRSGAGFAAGSRSSCQSEAADLHS
jgi:hypothetical protein